MYSCDAVAKGMEMKWGVNRLERLVSKDLRDKFIVQRNLYNEAILSNDAKKIERLSEAMRRAWVALDAAATADGQEPLPSQIWTAEHPKTGDVVTVIRDDAQLVDVEAAGGRLFTMEELVAFIPPEIMRIKESFYRSKVTKVTDKRIASEEVLDDEIPF